MTRIAWVLLGAALLAWLIVSSGLSSIVADLGRIGPRLLVILALELVVDACNTLGWWFTLPPADRAGAFARLFWIRSSGNALNEVTPSASLGGEAAKVVLLRPRLSTAPAMASLLAARTILSSAKVLFILGGMAAVWPRLVLPSEARLALGAGLALVVIGIAAFVVIQVRGVGAGMAAALRRVGLPARWVARIEEWLLGVDAHLRDLYRGRRVDLGRALGACLCGLACGALQILLLMSWLGLPFDPPAALGVEAFATLVGFVMFVIPGSLGVQEGGKVLIFSALGLPRSAAMAVGLTFRLISLTEIAIGLVALVLLQHRSLGRPARPGTIRDQASRDAPAEPFRRER